MHKLTKVEADQLMEKFGKLTPTAYSGGSPPTLTWREGNREMELNMYSTLTWTLDSKQDYGRHHFDTVGRLDFDVFPLWQRIRLNFFFKRIWREARATYKAKETASRFAKSIATANQLLGLDDA